MKKKWRYGYFIWLCCISLLLISCSEPVQRQQGNSQPTMSTVKTPTQAELHATATQQALNQEQTKIQQLMKDMTLETKIGQLFMMEYITGIDSTYYDYQYHASAQYDQTNISAIIEKYHVGGFLVQQSNGNTKAPYNVPETFKTDFVDKMQAASDIPMLVAMDVEGGQVQKLTDLYPNDYIPPAANMVTQGPEKTKEYGQQVAQLMKDVGINVNLAPVVDVGPITNQLQDRLFSEDPKTVTTYAGAFLEGTQEKQVIGTLKHFPGLGTLPGGISNDPHNGLSTIHVTREQLEQSDFIPYKGLISKHQPSMIMTSNVFVPAIEPDLPAELSSKIVDGILRRELGYDGVIITDAIYMMRKWSGWEGIGAMSLKALLAGNDIIEGPYSVEHFEEILTVFKQALQDGTLTEQRIDQSVERILKMKLHYGLIK